MFFSITHIFVYLTLEYLFIFWHGFNFVRLSFVCVYLVCVCVRALCRVGFPHATIKWLYMPYAIHFLAIHLLFFFSQTFCTQWETSMRYANAWCDKASMKFVLVASDVIMNIFSSFSTLARIFIYRCLCRRYLFVCKPFQLVPFSPVGLCL